MSASKTDRQFMKDAQVGFLGSTAMAAPVTEVAKVHQRIAEVSLGSVATTAGSTYNIPIMTTDRAIKVISAKIVIPNGASTVTANDTNYVTISVSSNNDAGGALNPVASQTTKITGGLGNLVAATSYSLPVTASAAAVATPGALHAQIVPSGTGVSLPAWALIQVLYEEV